LEFRPAAESDIPALVALVESAYPGEIAALLTAPKSLLVTVHQMGRLVACCHVAEEDGAGYFGLFAVVPGLQGGGVGRAVLAEAERIVSADWGLAELRMKVVNRRADLIAWYIRRGYVQLPGSTPFPYGDERFGKPLVPDLAFFTLVKRLDAPGAHGL
jgi:GNAT superfamily N-acetyltransferase